MDTLKFAKEIIIKKFKQSTGEQVSLSVAIPILKFTDVYIASP